MAADRGLEAFERSLAGVSRLLSDRAVTGDLATRSGHDLPAASWSLLEHLAENGPLRVSDLAACHGVDVSSVTPRLQRLESAGLVTRERVSQDARTRLIRIAPDGEAALERIHAARRQILAEALTGADAADLARAAALLDQIGRHLEPRPVIPA